MRSRVSPSRSISFACLRRSSSTARARIELIPELNSAGTSSSAGERYPPPSGGFRAEAGSIQSPPPRTHEQPSWSATQRGRQRDGAPPAGQPPEPPECAAGCHALVPRSRMDDSSRARSRCTVRGVAPLVRHLRVRCGWSRRNPAFRPETRSRGYNRWQNPRRSPRDGRRFRSESLKRPFAATQSAQIITVPLRCNGEPGIYHREHKGAWAPSAYRG
jgi:hypothetical protein